VSVVRVIARALFSDTVVRQAEEITETADDEDDHRGPPRHRCDLGNGGMDTPKSGQGVSRMADDLPLAYQQAPARS
jgi:hypothetical protein